MSKKGQTIEELQERQKGPRNKWEKGAVLGPEAGLGVGLPPREKVDVPVETPDDMDPSEGQRSEYLYDVYSLPQPVVLVTTADLDGNVNCAPKNWVTCAGSHGFVFVCSTDHDTYMNVQSTGEFVVNVPGADLVPRLHALARKGAPSWENEMKRAGLTAVPSRKVRPPRVGECRVHLECKAELLYEVDNARELKSAKQGVDVLVYGKIVALSGDAEVVRAPTYEERTRLINPFVLTPIWNWHSLGEPKPVPEAWDIEY